MPELPEVQTLLSSLEPHLLGRRVDAVRILRPGVCECWEAGRGSLHAVRPSPTQLLAGDTIARMVRRGKQLAIIAESGRVMCVHLGMSGQVLIQPADFSPSCKQHDHVAWSLAPSPRADRQTLVFRDPRRFGGIWTYSTVADLERHHWHALGPDALFVTAKTLVRALADSTRAVKAALLDQSVLAGVGNIYADEALHAAGIHPRKRCDALTEKDWRKLAPCIRGVLKAAVVRRGSTLRDYRDADGSSGTAQVTHKVYGRSGLPCATCQSTLRSTTIAQRTTVWCPSCQKRR